jgi:hypothetical protein
MKRGCADGVGSAMVDDAGDGKPSQRLDIYGVGVISAQLSLKGSLGRGGNALSDSIRRNTTSILSRVRAISGSSIFGRFGQAEGGRNQSVYRGGP